MAYKDGNWSVFHWLIIIPLIVGIWGVAIWSNYTFQKYIIKQAIMETKNVK